MSHDVAHAHHEHPDVVGSRNRLGVVLLLVADISFAISVLFVYFYLKQQNVNDMWLPRAKGEDPGVEPVSSLGAWYICAMVGVGFLLNSYAHKGAKLRNHAQIMLGTGLAFAISIVALVYQIQLISRVEFDARMGAYASSYFLIAILNVVHIVLTAFIAFGNWNRGRLGLYEKDYWHLAISNVWWIWMTVSAGLGAFALSF